MKFDVKIPAAGESVTEATIGKWVKQSGEYVKMNDVMLVLETDKASLEVVAEQEGALNILVPEGKTVPIGTVIANIDSSAKPSASATNAQTAPPPQPAAPMASGSPNTHLSPAVQKIVTEKNLDPSSIQGTGPRGRITKEDVVKISPTPTPASAPTSQPTSTAKPHSSKPQRREPMTTIRKRIAERLVMSQQTTATLTTFNEVDLTKIMSLRAKYKDKFKEKYGVSLGFMGFFVKASVEALKAWPAVNAFIEGTEIIYNDYYNIGVAVGTEKGLIVPVIRNVENLSIAQIEMAIRDFAIKARDGKITIDDLSGGTFTVSNGGVYGSLMSTPILNPPQSAILGMHKIEDRAKVIDGKIEIRPMMYLAVSYDHRIIDGKEAVSFLVKIKEGLEDPERLLLEI